MQIKRPKFAHSISRITESHVMWQCVNEFSFICCYLWHLFVWFSDTILCKFVSLVPDNSLSIQSTKVLYDNWILSGEIRTKCFTHFTFDILYSCWYYYAIDHLLQIPWLFPRNNLLKSLIILVNDWLHRHFTTTCRLYILNMSANYYYWYTKELC